METHLSRGFRWNSSQPVRSCRHWIGRRPKFGDQPQDVGEELSRDGDLGHLEGDIVAVSDDLGTNLDELLLQADQRPAPYRLGRCQCAQEVAEVVSESMKLEPDRLDDRRP